MFKLIRSSARIPTFKPFLRRNFLLHNFSTSKQEGKLASKQEGKLAKKLERENYDKNLSNLETLADQEELTNEKIKILIEERRKEIEAVAGETKIPINAFSCAILITLPIFLTPTFLFFSLKAGYLSAIPLVAKAYLKYNAVHLCFFVFFFLSHSIRKK